MKKKNSSGWLSPNGSRLPRPGHVQHVDEQLTLAAIAHKLARAVVPREVVEKSLQAANQELREMGANPEFLESEVGDDD